MRKRAFTLIEILVVISIISLLASIITASFKSAREKARDSRRFEDLASVRNGIELYYHSHGFYPAQNDFSILRTEGFMQQIPRDPVAPSCNEILSGYSTGLNCYGYSWEPTLKPQKYHLWAELEERSGALESDNDTDSTDWLNGASTDGGDEFDCSDDTPADCVYDLSAE